MSCSSEPTNISTHLARRNEPGSKAALHEAWTRTKDEKATPGSDLEHIGAPIRAHGYKTPAGMMYVRLVHLLDEQKALFKEHGGHSCSSGWLRTVIQNLSARTGNKIRRSPC